MSGFVTVSSSRSYRHVFKAFPSRLHICALRARKCTISIFQRHVRKPASEPTTAIWRPTVGYACGEPYVPSFTLFMSRQKLNRVLLVTVSCSDYLCQDSLVCVQRPMDCPCPVVQDVKCIVPDAQEPGSGTRLCIRGATDCSQVEKQVTKFAK